MSSIATIQPNGAIANKIETTTREATIAMTILSKLCRPRSRAKSASVFPCTQWMIPNSHVSRWMKRPIPSQKMRFKYTRTKK